MGGEWVVSGRLRIALNVSSKPASGDAVVLFEIYGINTSA